MLEIEDFHHAQKSIFFHRAKARSVRSRFLTCQVPERKMQFFPRVEGEQMPKLEPKARVWTALMDLSCTRHIESGLLTISKRRLSTFMAAWKVGKAFL